MNKAIIIGLSIFALGAGLFVFTRGRFQGLYNFQLPRLLSEKNEETPRK